MLLRLLTTTRTTLLSFGLSLAMLLLATSNAMAIIIVSGTPVTTAPPYSDATVGPNQFLLPIQAIGAAGLQDWSFNLSFDPSVVQQVDLGGFYYGVYGAEFNIGQPALSLITSSGFLLPGLLEGIAGFSSDVTGDGFLAFIGFEFLAGQGNQDPGFEIGGVNAAQSVPEPVTALLLAAGLLVLGRSRRRSGNTRTL